MKRIAIATVFGLLAGLVCAFAGSRLGAKITTVSFVWIMMNRALLGYTIGISGLRLHWALHGPVMGAIVGSLFSYYAYMEGSEPLLVGGSFVASMIFGLLIELLTTVVFKQPQPRPAEKAFAAVR